MQVTSTQININTKRDDSVEVCRYLNSSNVFTLVELITSIAIIGILAVFGIHQYTQYKVRAYDAHSKQALHDMNLACRAYWIVNGTPEECDLAKSKEYGFVQNPDVEANVLSTLPENFCASAKHNQSPNTYSSNYVGVVSDNADCGLAAELAAKAEADRITAELAAKAEADRIAAELAALDTRLFQNQKDACNGKYQRDRKHCISEINRLHALRGIKQIIKPGMTYVKGISGTYKDGVYVWIKKGGGGIRVNSNNANSFSGRADRIEDCTGRGTRAVKGCSDKNKYNIYSLYQSREYYENYER